MKHLLIRVPGLIFLMALFAPATVQGQHWLHDDGSRTNQSIFRLMEEWATPNSYRTGAGSPGPDYWQQQVDYVIETRLDTVNHVVSGSERITYHNNSPEDLTFLWVQLDQNVRSIRHSRSYQMQGALPEEISPAFRRFVGLTRFDGGHNITRVQLVGPEGALVDADYRINNTVMRINLPHALPAGGVMELEIDWNFLVPDQGRGAKERLTDGYIYELAQWFPRMSVFDDVNGWHTDQFLGRGEFYLNFGNYDVKITVPWNHIVDATGELQNPAEVLTPTQIARLEEAYQSEEPRFIIPADEVMEPGTRPVREGMVTWHYRAEDVRDFAWVSSKLFVWDAAGFRYSPEHEVIKVHSLYPREAMPLWDKVSTRATLQTLKTYGRLAFEYPYPKAINVNGPQGGMEYPMVAFCGVRPQPDGSYSDAAERALIGVTIHEVGHNWFPMIVDSDERKWTWMDEGLNTFLQYYGQLDYAKTYCGTYFTQNESCAFEGGRGPAPAIVGYMQDPDQVPIMTESDLIHKDFGNNGYSKPATGLVMLRENILEEGPFDEAFSGYARKWMFKQPKPADFFRSMEDGAGEHLAWFWRGWFYTTHANDQALAEVSTQPAEALIGTNEQGRYYHRIRIENEGGLVMPVELEVTYADGSVERIDLPVDVWRSNELSFTKGFFSHREIQKVVLDPEEAYADIDRSDNVWTAVPAGT
ncbi:MAG: M1 family metallopeptidase [Gemmatimonadota bacterium]